MTPEQRIAALEADLATLRALLIALVGGQQALLFGLKAAITASPERRGSAEFARLMEQAEASMLASGSSDATLDAAADGRRHLAELIQAAFVRSEAQR